MQERSEPSVKLGDITKLELIDARTGRVFDLTKHMGAFTLDGDDTADPAAAPLPSSLSLSIATVGPSSLLAFYQESAEVQRAIDQLAVIYPFPRGDIALWFAAYCATQPSSWRECYAVAQRSPAWLPESAQVELRQHIAAALEMKWRPLWLLISEAAQQIAQSITEAWQVGLAGLSASRKLRRMFPTPRGQGIRREARRALRRKGKRGR